MPVTEMESRSRIRVVSACDRDGEAGAQKSRAGSAVYLSEVLSEIDQGAGFLDRLTLNEINAVRKFASPMLFQPGNSVFLQGDIHSGIFLIDSGRVRIYYAGPSGREITLAYWTPGHFIGGPEVFGGGVHMWSAVVVEPSRLSYLPAAKLKQLAMTVPAFAVALIEGLVAKGKCYSALVQMLGTRSVTERLAQLLIILASVERQEAGSHLVIDKRITHEQLASIVGSTRQWVTSTLARFHKAGIIRIDRGRIHIERPEALSQDLE